MTHQNEQQVGAINSLNEQLEETKKQADQEKEKLKTQQNKQLEDIAQLQQELKEQQVGALDSLNKQLEETKKQAEQEKEQLVTEQKKQLKDMKQELEETKKRLEDTEKQVAISKQNEQQLVQEVEELAKKLENSSKQPGVEEKDQEPTNNSNKKQTSGKSVLQELKGLKEEVQIATAKESKEQQNKTETSMPNKEHIEEIEPEQQTEEKQLVELKLQNSLLTAKLEVLDKKQAEEIENLKLEFQKDLEQTKETLEQLRREKHLLEKKYSLELNNKRMSSTDPNKRSKELSDQHESIEKEMLTVLQMKDDIMWKEHDMELERSAWEAKEKQMKDQIEEQSKKISLLRNVVLSDHSMLVDYVHGDGVGNDNNNNRPPNDNRNASCDGGPPNNQRKDKEKLFEGPVFPVKKTRAFSLSSLPPRTVARSLSSNSVRTVKDMQLLKSEMEEEKEKRRSAQEENDELKLYLYEVQTNRALEKERYSSNIEELEKQYFFSIGLALKLDNALTEKIQEASKAALAVTQPPEPVVTMPKQSGKKKLLGRKRKKRRRPQSTGNQGLKSRVDQDATTKERRVSRLVEKEIELSDLYDLARSREVPKEHWAKWLSEMLFENRFLSSSLFEGSRKQQDCTQSAAI